MEQSSRVNLSQHAARRSKSRGIDLSTIETVLKYGVRRSFGDGRSFVRIPKGITARVSDLADAHDVTVILGPDSRVVTVYRGKPKWNR